MNFLTFLSSPEFGRYQVQYRIFPYNDKEDERMGWMNALHEWM